MWLLWVETCQTARFLRRIQVIWSKFRRVRHEQGHLTKKTRSPYRDTVLIGQALRSFFATSAIRYGLLTKRNAFRPLCCVISVGEALLEARIVFMSG
jgi:chorismate-pyruvate lyase